MALLLAGSYFFTNGLGLLILLPLMVVIAGLSGAQAQAQAQAMANAAEIQLIIGIICLAGSLFVAFFKFGTVNRYSQPSQIQTSIPQLSRPSVLSTEELISELKLRMPRT